jgi:hypothetical protein
MFLVWCREKKEFVPKRVDSISIVQKLGFYCPLTTSGKVVINGILASCYVADKTWISQNLAHTAMKPL